MRISIIILLGVIFLQCQTNEEISFLPIYKIKNNNIYRIEREPSHELSKTKELYVYRLPDIIGMSGNFDFKKVDIDLVYNKEYIGTTENFDFNNPYIFTSTKISKLSYLNSYVYIGNPYEAGILKRYNPIVTGIIQDPEIIMQNNLRIGMNKKAALNRLFVNSFVAKYRAQMLFADTLILSDHWSIMKHTIIFNNEKLQSVEMEYMPEKRYLELINPNKI